MRTERTSYTITSDLGKSLTDNVCAGNEDDRNSYTIGSFHVFTPQTYSASTSRRETSKATPWETLTLRLGLFARQHIEKYGAGSIKDEMLQNEARFVLYGNTDDSQPTVADNSQWLNLFKIVHGIGPKVPLVGEFF